MQTFLPYSDFKKSVQCLDYRRCGKQRVEAMQILNVLLGQSKSNAWKNHPIVKMWKGYEEALKLYMNECIQEWIRRGYKNTMKLAKVNQHKVKLPSWFGNKAFHSSHKAALLQKNYNFYKQFNWKEKPEINYVWFV